MYFEKIGLGIKTDDISRAEEIQMNKAFSSLLSEVQEETKEAFCFSCGKEVSSFCNSHLIPRFCLANIGVEGKVTGFNAILGLPSMGIAIGKEFPGINEAGTFKMICRECDSSLFQDYENPDNYSDTPPSSKMLAQNNTKNYLKFISKRKAELVLSRKSVEKETGDEALSLYLKKKHTVSTPVKTDDLDAYISCFKRAKKCIDKNTSGYYLVYYNLLDHVAPIAIQSPVSLLIDIEGNVVNDSFSSPTYNPTDIHVCVFPLHDKTAVILFINDGDTRYRKFYKQLRKLSEEDQLGVINYMIFLYCEDYFLAKELPDRIDLAQFKKVAEITPVIWSSTPITDTSLISDQFTLAKWNTIPNLLSEKHKIR